MISIGVTGGIGTGKSTICAVLETMGYPVFYADAEAKKCMTDDPLLRQEIVAQFGSEAYVQGSLNRSYLASIIFRDPSQRDVLNQLVHPAVYRAFEQWKTRQSATLLFNESALLFETGSYRRFHATILVTAEREVRIQRVMERDSISREQVIDRMNNQWDDTEKIALASFVIRNNPTDLVVPQLVQIVEQLTALQPE